MDCCIFCGIVLCVHPWRGDVNDAVLPCAVIRWQGRKRCTRSSMSNDFRPLYLLGQKEILCVSLSLSIHPLNLPRDHGKGVSLIFYYPKKNTRGLYRLVAPCGLSLFEAICGLDVERVIVILKSLIPLHPCFLGDRTAKSHCIAAHEKA